MNAGSHIFHDSYEMSTSAPDWVDAEAQVKRTLDKKKGGEDGDAPTVSVKSAVRKAEKRKGDSVEDVWREEIGEKEGKRARKAKGKGKGR